MFPLPDTYDVLCKQTFPDYGKKINAIQYIFKMLVLY